MKRFFAWLLCICIITNCSVVYAANEPWSYDSLMSKAYCNEVYRQISETPNISSHVAKRHVTVTIEKASVLYSLSDAPIAVLYTFEPCGYAIYDPVEQIVLEYSTTRTHRYPLAESIRRYYDGVLRYYIRTASGFQDLSTGLLVEETVQSVFNSSDFYNAEELNETNTRAIGSETISAGRRLIYGTRHYDCNTSENMSFFYPNGHNSPGVCGSTACAILLAYYDDHLSHLAGDGDFATNSKKTYGLGEEHQYGIKLVQELVSYIEPSGIGSVLLDSGMEDYLADHGISGGLALGLFSAYDAVKNTIEEDIPLIVGLLSRHYAVAVGYKNYNGKQIKIDEGNGQDYIWVASATILSTWTLYVD